MQLSNIVIIAEAENNPTHCKLLRRLSLSLSLISQMQHAIGKWEKEHNIHEAWSPHETTWQQDMNTKKDIYKAVICLEIIYRVITD